MKEITVVRVYMLESEHHLDKLLKLLHDEFKIYHVTVFRGIEGFEKGGEMQVSRFLSLSVNLPLVVEFFDTPEQVKKTLEAVEKITGNGKIVTFRGNLQ